MQKSNTSKGIIIETAKAIFSKYGYKKTSIDDIIASSGMSKGAFYYYFKGKDDIFKSVVLSEADEIQNKLIKALTISNNSVDKLKNYIRFKIQAVNDVLNLYNVINNDFLYYLGYIKEITDQHTNFELNIIRSIINEGIERKEMHCACPNTTSEILLNMINSFEIFVNTKKTDFETWNKEFINLITRGLKNDA